MKQMLLAVLLLGPATAWAQGGPLDGTWKVDLASAQFPDKPDQFELKDGRYTCSSCVPAIDVKSDGTDQQVSGSKYYDTIAVQVVDDRTIKSTMKQDGKITSESTTTVAADGTTLTESFKGYPPAGAPVTGQVLMERVAKGPAGSHAISGSWRVRKVADVADAGLTFTYKTTADGIRMSTPTGESYDAKFDGKDYPVKGDRGGSMVMVKKVDDRTIEETTKRDGKIVSVSRTTAGADGATLTIVSEDKERGTTTKYQAKKQ